jgi:uncharacterized protein YndB with AHSA1/START domain
MLGFGVGFREPSKEYTIMPRLPRPDLSERPHRFTVERAMKAPPTAIYRAWTEQFDAWFARPGTVWMRAEVDVPFYFEVNHAGGRHAHYGRFLTLEPDRFLELTWMTGEAGTRGAETVISVELTATGAGTHLRLTHAGFYDEASAEQHNDAWPQVLAHLDERLAEMS